MDNKKEELIVKEEKIKKMYYDNIKIKVANFCEELATFIFI